jgi:hypothetical protein
MALLNIKITESKKVPGNAKIRFACTEDIKHSIITGVNDAFEIEMLKSGTISQDGEMCIIKFKMQDGEKLTRLKQGVFAALLKVNSHIN